MTARMVVAAAAIALAGAGAAAWAVQGAPVAAPAAVPASVAAAPGTSAQPDANAKGATPMAERIATLGILNKRNGLSRDLRMKPGQAVHINDLVVRLRACDQTEPYENEQLTGAFVQVIVQGNDARWRKYFSGWLYKESPSLNVVEHPVWDVWVKECTMRHPEVGPDTVVLTGAEAGESNAAKSPKGGRSADASATR
jgi:hypothetical protein